MNCYRKWYKDGYGIAIYGNELKESVAISTAPPPQNTPQNKGDDKRVGVDH